MTVLDLSGCTPVDLTSYFGYLLARPSDPLKPFLRSLPEGGGVTDLAAGKARLGQWVHEQF